MKLTFAKAEHLKRNATAAADPKAVFQAMRPVFGDLLTELQRSIGYFSNIDRAAKIGRVLALGNAMKLPGLRRYLAQSLGYDIERVQSFQGLVGSQVLSSPIFKENVICYGICYGLTLQGLNKPGLHTNLLPKEIVKDRLVKRKKPWAVAAAAALLLGCGVSFGAYSLAMGSVDKSLWKPAIDQADNVIRNSSQLKSEAGAADGGFKSTDQIGQHLLGNVEGRLRWLELMRAIDRCLPRDVSKVESKKETLQPAGELSKAAKPVESKDESASKNTDSNALQEQITDRNELHVKNLECQYCDDVSTWFSIVKQWYRGPDLGAQSGGASAEASQTTTPDAGQAAAPAASGTAEQQAGESNFTGPKGSGWIVKLEGYHYHNNKQKAGDDDGAQFVRNTLIDNLLKEKVELPNGDGIMEDVSMRELGITYPVLINPKIVEQDEVDNPYAHTDGSGTITGAAGRRGTAEDSAAGKIKLRRFDFVVQFCWQPKSPSERRAAKEEAKKNQQAASAGEQLPPQQ